MKHAILGLALTLLVYSPLTSQHDDDPHKDGGGHIYEGGKQSADNGGHGMLGLNLETPDCKVTSSANTYNVLKDDPAFKFFEGRS